MSATATMQSILHSVVDFLNPPVNHMTGAVYTSPFLLSPDLIQRDKMFKSNFIQPETKHPGDLRYSPHHTIDNPLSPENDWSATESGFTTDHSAVTSDFEGYHRSTTHPRLNTYSQHTSPFQHYILPQVEFVKKGTVEFEIFLDVQEQKIEHRRNEYVELAKRSARSLGHPDEQLALFDHAPTREIIKYLDYHGEFIEELCETPPEFLPVHFYIPNDDGTIPSEFYYDKIEPILFHKLIQPELPDELKEELKKTQEHLEHLERQTKRKNDLLLHPEQYMIVNDDNWEKWLPQLLDPEIFPDFDSVRDDIRSIISEERRTEQFSDHVRNIQKTTPMFSVKEIKTGDQVTDYEIDVSPYFWHPVVEPLFAQNDQEFNHGDLFPEDPESFVAAERILANLDKLASGEYTEETYPDTDPGFAFREMRKYATGEMPVFTQRFIELNNMVYDHLGDEFNNPELLALDPTYNGILTPNSLEEFHEQVKTDPFYRQMSGDTLDTVIPDMDVILTDGWEYLVPEAKAQILAQDEHIRRMWVDFDEDYIDEQINQITPHNEHLYRDIVAEENDHREQIFLQRQKLEEHLAEVEPGIYKEWIRHLYNHFHGLEYDEAYREVYEIDAEQNEWYGDEAKSVRELFFRDIELDWAQRSDQIELFRPPDGDLGDLEDDPRWLEYYHFDPVTGDSLVDETGRLLSAAEYREKRRIQEDAEQETIQKTSSSNQPVSEQEAGIFSWLSSTLWGVSPKSNTHHETDESGLDSKNEHTGKSTPKTTARTKQPSSYTRLENPELFTPEFRENQLELERLRLDAIRRAQIQVHTDLLKQERGTDEFDLLMTRDTFTIPKPEPEPLVLPDLHIDTVRRKVAIMNGDIEEDEEDDPLAADMEWADPDNIRIESERMKDIDKFSYDKLDQQYIRKEKAAQERYGDGLESLEYLHVIGDRYDRREDNLSQKVEKTSAKFRQLDKDVQKLQKLRDELQQFKTQKVFKKDFSNDHQIVALEKQINILSAGLKERFQDEELEYSRLEWDGIKDRVEFLNDKTSQGADYKLKQLHRQKYLHIDYESNPEEGENFRDAYIRERIEQEQKKVKEQINLSLQKHPSLIGTIQIKDKSDIQKLTMLLFREFGNDPLRLKEAIAKLPIQFHTKDVMPLIDNQIAQFLENPHYSEDDLNEFGVVDKKLLGNIIAAMKDPDLPYDVIQARKHANEFQEISGLLQTHLLPSTIQSRIDDLERTQADIPLLQQIRNNPNLANDIDAKTLSQAHQSRSQLEKSLKNELRSYQKNYIDDSAQKGIQQSYKEAYHPNNNKKKLAQEAVPQFQIITPSKSTPWKSWNQKLETEGFVQPGENEREMRQQNLKNEFKRLYPDFQSEYERLSPRDKKFVDSIDDNMETVRQKMLDDLIDPDAPEPLRKQRLHEVAVFEKLTGIDLLSPVEQFGEINLPDNRKHDFFHPMTALRFLRSPTKNRVFGKSFKNPQNEIEYRRFLLSKKGLRPDRIHSHGNIWDRAMVPKPSDLIHYQDKTYEEIRELIWNEEDKGAERIRKAPHRVWHIPHSKHERLYDILGELKTQAAPNALVEKTIIDTLGKTSPLKSEQDAAKFYDEFELSQDVVPVHFIDSYNQIRPKQSHLEDEIEHHRRSKIEEYYRQKSNSNFNYYNENKLSKDRKVFQQKSAFEGKMRKQYYDERAIKLGIFGQDVDPDSLDEEERSHMMRHGNEDDIARFFDFQGTKDDPTKKMRYLHPDVNFDDYDEFELFGPSNGNSLFEKVKDHKRFVEDDSDYLFDQPLTLKNKKTGQVILHDDPINNLEIPGVELRRFDPGFKGDMDRLTKQDFSSRDKHSESDRVYEQYRDSQYDRWRSNLLEQGSYAEAANEAAPKLPKATYRVRKQAMEQKKLTDRSFDKLGIELGKMQRAYAEDELMPDQIEQFRDVFHGTGKRAYFDETIPHTDGDYNEDPYYSQKDELDLPAREFMNQNPQFMKPRHTLHKAQPIHTPIPRPKTFAPQQYQQTDPLYSAYIPNDIQREEAWFKKDQDRIIRDEKSLMKAYNRNMNQLEIETFKNQAPYADRVLRDRDAIKKLNKDNKDDYGDDDYGDYGDDDDDGDDESL